VRRQIAEQGPGGLSLRAIARQMRMASSALYTYLDNPGDFALIFGTPAPGYQAPESLTGPAAARFAAVPLGV
jgi:Bacterial regulatory proteins, tetR family